jgi:hypothetical protein
MCPEIWLPPDATSTKLTPGGGIGTLHWECSFDPQVTIEATTCGRP